MKNILQIFGVIFIAKFLFAFTETGGDMRIYNRVHVNKMAIDTVATGTTTNPVLVYDEATKEVKKVSGTSYMTVSQANDAIATMQADINGKANKTATVTINGDSQQLNTNPNFTLKLPVSYSGTTNSSGVYTVTFPTAYNVAPNVQASVTNQSNTNQFIRVSSVTTTGFTVNVFQRSAVTILGAEVLLAATTNVNGASVDVLVTPK